MLLWFVVAYWIISIGIGLYAATRVHNTKDFAIAGRQLPFYMVTATVFATWFGAETVLGIPATFLKEGLHGVVAEDVVENILCQSGTSLQETCQQLTAAANEAGSPDNVTVMLIRQCSP